MQQRNTGLRNYPATAEPYSREKREQAHAVRLARNLWPGSDDSDGFDRHRCRRPFYCRSQSGAAVYLHRRLRKLAQWPRFGLDQRRDRGRRVGCCFSSTTTQRPGYDTADLVRLLLLAMTAAGTAAITGLLRKRMMDAFASAAQALCHRRAPARPALDQVDIGIVLLDSGHPRGIHQPRLPRLFLAFRRESRQQAALHRADVSWPRYRRL